MLVVINFGKTFSSLYFGYCLLLIINKTSWVCSAKLEFDYRFGWVRVGFGLGWVGMVLVWCWVGVGLGLGWVWVGHTS